jgi:ribose 5-phosphate isomerase A
MSEELKREAAIAALEEIRGGMVVGLGTGSTAAHFIRELAAKVRAGLDIIAIPTSEASRKQAEEGGIRLTTLADHPHIDVTVDGADEVSPQLDLTKGLGGALVREKIVAHATSRVVIVVDEGKLVEKLGAKTVIPIEVIPFAAEVVMRQLAAWGGHPQIRVKEGKTFVSDNGNVVVDWKVNPIDQPALLEKQIKGVTGVVDSGLFCGVAQLVIVAGSGGVRKMLRESARSE